MTANGIEVLAVSAPGPDVSALRVPHQAVAMTRAITPFRDLIALFQLIVVIIRFRPDIVHTHTPKAGLLGMLAARVCRTPVRIHTIGGLPWLEATGFKRWLLKQMELLTIWASTDTLINSINLRTVLKSELPDLKKKILVLGKGSTNGIDSNHFSMTPLIRKEAEHLRQDLRIAPDDIVFCFVGRLALHKGITELVNAFDRIRQQHAKVHLLLTGYFEYGRETLSQNLEKRIKAGNGITVTGLIEDVRPYLAASNVLVFPSYREGFPNVLMQAGCLGIPVIATDINGCNEILEGSAYGMLIPPKNTDALTDAMNSFLNDPESFQKKSKELRSHILTNYDQAKIWEDLLSFYRSRLHQTTGWGTESPVAVNDSSV